MKMRLPNGHVVEFRVEHRAMMDEALARLFNFHNLNKRGDKSGSARGKSCIKPKIS